MDGNYGVPRDIFAKAKIIGMYILDILAVVISGILSFVYGTKIFPATHVIRLLLFILLSIGIVFYLVLPTKGGKRNINAFLLLLKRRKHRYVSIDRMFDD